MIYRVSIVAEWLIKNVEIRNGYGRHIYIYDDPAVRAEKSSSWLKGLYTFEFFFHTATTLSKFAMSVILSLSHNIPADRSMTSIRLAFYYRIFPILRFRRICIWVAHFSWLYMVSVDLTIVFQWQVDSAPRLSFTSANVNSHPIHYAWDRFTVDVQGHCLNVDRFFIGSGSVNCALNFLIFVLVCPRSISPSLGSATDTETADTTLVPPSYNCKATNSPDGSVHLGWLVCPTIDLLTFPIGS